MSGWLSSGTTRPRFERVSRLAAVSSTRATNVTARSRDSWATYSRTSSRARLAESAQTTERRPAAIFAEALRRLPRAESFGRWAGRRAHGPQPGRRRGGIARRPSCNRPAGDRAVREPFASRSYHEL